MKSVRIFMRQHRRALLNAATILGIVLLLCLNILFPNLLQAKGSYIDSTPEDLYTLSSAMVDTCGSLKGEITITFCMDPDRLLENYESRYVYIMALQLADKYEHIHVQTYNIVENPTAVNRFKATSATQILPTHVIVSCEKRYRILSATSFWTLGESSIDNTDYYSFNGEYRLATALLAVTSIVEPVVCFTYGHGEHIYVDPTDTTASDLLAISDAERRAFYSLMRDAGLKVQYVDLDNEEIPEDCVLLIMDGPTVDYSIGNPNSISERTPFRRIHEFLASDMGSMMLFKDPTALLPNLEEFMEDWGISYDDEHFVTKDEGHYIRDDAAHTLTGNNQQLLVSLSSDESSVAYSIYSDVVNIGTAPRTIVENTGAVSGSWLNDAVGASGTENVVAYYYDFFYSSENAYAYTTDGVLDNVNGADGATQYSLAGLSLRMKSDPYTNESYFSYMFGAATTALTTNTYLENRAYCNYDILFATVRYLSRVDEYASLELGGVSLNSPRPGGKPLQTVTITEGGNTRYDEQGLTAGYYSAVTQTVQMVWTILLIAIPVTICTILGTVFLIKRKNR